MCLHYYLRENPAVIGVSVFGCPITRWDGWAIYGATGIVGTVVVVLHDGWCRICPHTKKRLKRYYDFISLWVWFLHSISYVFFVALKCSNAFDLVSYYRCEAKTTSYYDVCGYNQLLRLTGWPVNRRWFLKPQRGLCLLLLLRNLISAGRYDRKNKICWTEM